MFVRGEKRTKCKLVGYEIYGNYVESDLAERSVNKIASSRYNLVIINICIRTCLSLSLKSSPAFALLHHMIVKRMEP